MEPQPEKPFTAILDTIKTRKLIELYGYKKNSSWYRMKANPAGWTVAQIHQLAQLVHRTPAELFKAISQEIEAFPVDEIPPPK